MEGRDESQQGHWDQLSSNKDAVLNVRREMASRSSRLALIVDYLGKWLAHPAFLIALTVFHVGWLLWNSGWLAVPRFDRPPFAVLAMIASVEAPFLSVLILMHQRRQQRVAELREEVQVQVALHAERELTKLLALVADLHEAAELPASQRDHELEEMKKPLHPRRIIAELEQSLGQPERGQDNEPEAEEHAQQHPDQ